MFLILIRQKDLDPKDMNTSRTGLFSCFTCLLNRIKACLWEKRANLVFLCKEKKRKSSPI
jgi:hypothetical protein